MQFYWWSIFGDPNIVDRDKEILYIFYENSLQYIFYSILRTQILDTKQGFKVWGIFDILFMSL